MKRSRMVVAALLALGLAGCQRPVSIMSQLSGSQEVPPTASAGTATLTGLYYPSTNALTYSLAYDKLSGPATGAHLHGPAVAGQNAPVVIPFTVTPTPISGGATLTDAQAADLLAGKWYANIHTQQNPGGEIRGQVVHN